MEKIKFRTTDGTQCEGYLVTWEGLSFGLTINPVDSSNRWIVIELQTGCLVTGKQMSTRKEAIREAVELLNGKGLKAVMKKLKEIFVERGNTKAGHKIKTAHCTSPDDRLKTLCGRIKKEYCLPLKYFKYAKRPCGKCQRLVERREAG